MQDLAYAWLALAVDISIKSILLAAGAGLVIFALRVRDPNLRHRIWTAVLVGMLAMPALVWVMPALPLPGWISLSIRQHATHTDPLDAKSADKDFANSRAHNNDPGRRAAESARPDSESIANSPVDRLAGNSIDPGRISDARAADQATATPDDQSNLEQSKSTSWIAPGFLTTLLCAYCAVATAFLARIAFGLALTRRLVAQSKEAQPAQAQLSRRRNVRLLESDAIHVPSTVGVIRPTVLMPLAWRTWSESKLQAVLAHELAHVRRADWLVLMAAELNRAIYWFHPVAWIVKRRLSELAERNCDDAVLEAHGDATQYARYLLEVASSLTAAGARYRTSLQGVAMARQSNVETRIEAILDAGRPLARRLGAWGIIGLVVIGVPAVLLAAALQSAVDDPKSMAAGAANPRPGAATMQAKDSGTKAGPLPNAASDTQVNSVPKSNRLHVKGRVLAPDGTPLGGAKVSVVWGLTRKDPPSYWTEVKTATTTESDAKGNFELDFSTEHPDPTRFTTGWQIVAAAPGFGPAWLADRQRIKDRDSNSDVTLTLAADQSIRGRIVDLEGNPIEGIRVAVQSISVADDEKQISDWIKDCKDRKPPSKLEEYYENQMSASGTSSPYPGPFPIKWETAQLVRGSPGVPIDVKTDREGRFQFSGVGRNRLAVLEVEGPAVAKSFVHVVAREMETVYAQPAESQGYRTGAYFGHDFQYVADSTQPIVGMVTDIETGKPLPHLQVSLGQFAGNTMTQWDFLSTETDDQGHYRLIGAPRGGGHRIEVNPPREQPYFPTSKRLAAASGFEPITCDFALRRGQWIVGKVTDRETGAPINELDIEYLPLRTNKTAQDYPNYDPQITGHTPANRYQSSADGSFRVLAIPGTGILGAIAQQEDQYKFSRVRTELISKDLVDQRGNLATYHPWIATGYHALREIDLAKSDQDTTFDLQLTQGLSRKLKFVDANGQPVSGVQVLGRRFPPRLEDPTKEGESEVQIIGLSPNDQRDVIAIQPKLRIGKVMTVAPGNDLTVQLQPCAIARGRVIDEEGKPARDLSVNVVIDRKDNWGRWLTTVATDRDGHFEALLSPGTTYRIWHFSRNGSDFSAECDAKPGIIFELGDIHNGAKLTTEQTEKMIVDNKLSKDGEIKAVSAESTLGQSPGVKQSIVRGQIIGVDDKPAAGADVALLAMRMDAGRGGDLDSRGIILAEAKTLTDGKFELSFKHLAPKALQEAYLIARTGASALTWKALNLNGQQDDVSLSLRPEETIAGKFVDIEGQPAAGVRLRIAGMMKRASGDEMATAGIWQDMKQLPAAWPQPAATTADGGFSIGGIPKDFGVYLQIEGNEKFAPQSVSLNTGMPEERGERDGTYRPQVVKNLKASDNAVLALAPAQLFTGTVRFEDSGQPAANARLTIWASQQKYGSMLSVAGRADEQGHYQISPNPGIRFGVTAYPPDGTPYLARQMEEIDWKSGDRSREVDVKLPRGVLVRGQVLDQDSGKPIANASILYEPQGAKNSSKAGNVLTGWQDSHVSDAQGRFEIVVMPGPGHLLVHAPQDEFVFKQISERELNSGRLGGRRYYAHAIERIEAQENVLPIDLNVQLKRGGTIHGELVDEGGATSKEAVMISRLYVSALSAYWRGFPQSVSEGRFEISGLAADQEYPIHFLDIKRRLGATLIAKAGMPAPRILLEPCGEAKVRFVDDAGKPVANYEPTVFMVITPGGVALSATDMKAGILAADEDFIRNIDQVNHPMPERADADGKMVIPALVPGASYRILTYRKQSYELAKDFQAKAKETIDLGDIVVERRE